MSLWKQSLECIRWSDHLWKTGFINKRTLITAFSTSVCHWVVYRSIETLGWKQDQVKISWTPFSPIITESFAFNTPIKSVIPSSDHVPFSSSFWLQAFCESGPALLLCSQPGREVPILACCFSSQSSETWIWASMVDQQLHTVKGDRHCSHSAIDRLLMIGSHDGESFMTVN